MKYKVVAVICLTLAILPWPQKPDWFDRSLDIILGAVATYFWFYKPKKEVNVIN